MAAGPPVFPLLTVTLSAVSFMRKSPSASPAIVFQSFSSNARVCVPAKVRPASSSASAPMPASDDALEERGAAGARLPFAVAAAAHFGHGVQPGVERFVLGGVDQRARERRGQCVAEQLAKREQLLNVVGGDESRAPRLGADHLGRLQVAGPAEEPRNERDRRRSG